MNEEMKEIQDGLSYGGQETLSEGLLGWDPLQTHIGHSKDIEIWPDN